MNIEENLEKYKAAIVKLMDRAEFSHVAYRLLDYPPPIFNTILEHPKKEALVKWIFDNETDEFIGKLISPARGFVLFKLSDTVTSSRLYSGRLYRALVTLDRQRAKNP